jgi:hypothetical protein
MREQLINVLQATVAFLLLTNALSVAAAAYAIRLAHGLIHGDGSRWEPRVHAFLSSLLPTAGVARRSRD